MEQRRRSGAGESVFDITRQEGLNRQQDLLYRISEDTGGHFLKNTNDIAGGLERPRYRVLSGLWGNPRSGEMFIDKI